MRAYPIPFFIRYEVYTPPFRVYDKQADREVALTRNARGIYCHVYNDDGRRLTISVLKLAVLAFHGQSPTDQPYLPYHYGGDYTPKTVRWLPRTQVLRLRRSVLSMKQQMTVLDKWEQGATQDSIAAQFEVSQPTIARIVNRRYLEHTFDSLNQ